MKNSHPALWGAGWAGLFAGGLMALVGLVSPGELAHLVGGYGLLMMAASVYLIGGLGLREALSRRSAAATASSQVRQPAPSAPRS